MCIIIMYIAYNTCVQSGSLQQARCNNRITGSHGLAATFILNSILLLFLTAPSMKENSFSLQIDTMFLRVLKFNMLNLS